LHILHGVGIGNPWFTTSSFAPAAGGTFGNVGRNYLSGPNFFNLDASLAKSIRFTERFNLELAPGGIWRDQHTAVLLCQQRRLSGGHDAEQR